MDPVVTRRSVIRGVIVTAGAGVVGYLVANNSSAASRKRVTTAANSSGYGGTTARKQLASVSSIPANGGIVLSKQDVVLTRDDTGAVHAFSATCTHQGCQVTEVKSGQIICPCHGSKFDAKTGDVITGPASKPLPTVHVSVEGNAVYTQ
jgi:Rieske Fe-S protein